MSLLQIAHAFGGSLDKREPIDHTDLLCLLLPCHVRRRLDDQLPRFADVPLDKISLADREPDCIETGGKNYNLRRRNLLPDAPVAVAAHPGTLSGLHVLGIFIIQSGVDSQEVIARSEG